MPQKTVKAKTTPVKPILPKTRLVEAPVTTKKDRVMPVLVAAIVVAAFAVGFLYGKVSVYEKVGVGNQATGQTAAAAPAPTTSVTFEKIQALFADKTNLVFGNPSSKVLFVEFSDPSCPYCHVAAGKDGVLNKAMGTRFTLKEDGGTYVAPVPEMKALVDQGKAAFVWLFSPGHGNGELGTQALYCAQEQGKFWQAHDLLMNDKGYELLNGVDVQGNPTKGAVVKNDTTKIPQLVDFLKGVVNAQQLQACISSGKYAPRVQSDAALATSYGVQGTPGFFVNDKNFAGAYSYTDMQSVVDAALK